MAIPDMSKLYEASGVRMVVIKSTGSPLKGAGIEGTSLSDEQMADLQASVDSIHEDFKAAIRAKRKMVADSALRGQVFSGKQAAAQIDELRWRAAIFDLHRRGIGIGGAQQQERPHQDNGKTQHPFAQTLHCFISPIHFRTAVIPSGSTLDRPTSGIEIPPSRLPIR